MKILKKKILYISYDGILEPLGNSQVLKYLECLSEEFDITLISFEKENGSIQSKDFLRMQKHCKEKNISWRPQKYRIGLGPISSIINLLNITFLPFLEMLFKRHQIIHIRSYMPGLAMPFLKIWFNFKLIFDIRGFWADEKVDRLGWKTSSIKYKFFKSLEFSLFKNADMVVTLTKSSKNFIEKNFNKPSTQVKVIRTCVDFNEFNMADRKLYSYNSSQELVIGYLGSIDTAYDFNAFLKFIKSLVSRNLKIKLKILSNTTKDRISSYLKGNGLEDISNDVVFLKRNELSNAISQFNLLGFALKESFSLIASMPTKIAESLACGTPIICNNFNSDIEEMISNNEIGLLYDFSKPLTEKSYQKLISLLQNTSTAETCFSFSQKYFSLNGGVEIYRKIYNSL